MRREILRGLFNGSVVPWERRVANNPKHHELFEKIDSEEKYFISKMSPDDQARFRELENLQMELGALEEGDVSAYAFSLGMLLMMDVTKEAELFCNDEQI